MSRAEDLPVVLFCAAVTPTRARRRDLRTFWLYAKAIVKEFRWTLAGVTLAVAVGGVLYGLTPLAALGGRRPDPLVALYGAWMALFAETALGPPDTWYLALLSGAYPLVGFVLVGEGIVRFALLMASKQRGEREWMKVMASTYRNHIVLCGLGHLGWRVLGQLLHRNAQVVAVEKDPDCRFLAQARSTGIPILVADMKDDRVLVEAGLPHAHAIIIATNDDMANLEAAMDARRMNPKIRVIMRLYDQQVAAKLVDALHVDAAFSSSALAAATVAAMSLDCKVLASYDVAGESHVAAEVAVAAGSPLVGKTIAALEAGWAVKVLARAAAGGSAAESPPPAHTAVAAGDTLTLHAPSVQIDELIAAGKSA